MVHNEEQNSHHFIVCENGKVEDFYINKDSSIVQQLIGMMIVA